MTAWLEWALDHYDIRYNANRSGEQSIKCPIHDDRNASASLNLGKELWNCHACGEGGDAIELVKLKEDMDFGAAKQLLESRAGGGDQPVRGKPTRSSGVSSEPGYKPRYRREVSTRRRRRPDFGP